MKNLAVLFLVLSLAYSSSGIPTDTDQPLVVQRQRCDVEVYENTKKFIEDFVENLRKATDEARDAISGFTSGLRDEAKQVREKIENDIKRFRERISKAVEIMSNRFSGSGRSVQACVTSHRNEISSLFNDTLAKALSCVTDRFRDANVQIQAFTTIVNGAVQSSNKSLHDMRKCTQEGSILTAGSCLGRVALKAEMQFVSFAAQSALTMGRISLGIASLPASLEVCAGTRLVEASVNTARILIEIGGCSANSVFSSYIDSSSQTTIPTVLSLLPFDKFLNIDLYLKLNY